MKGKHLLQKATRHVPPSSTTPSLPRPLTKSRRLPAHPSKSQKALTHPCKPNILKAPKKSSMPKPQNRKKTPRYLRSRNWRDRAASSTSSFSEDTIQRQLNYLVPRHEEPGCCWHACGWEGFVWCCGRTCWANDESARENVENVEGCVEVQVLTEKKVDRPLRALCRDEWECDFCGAECFCEWVLGK
ncbi:hypothetical protein HBI42_063670 [Parastagonospora nodorum]|nr:hypothetical protein HBH51_047480 [Parastagonospora nodorum]KAH4202697.1 hypothetical protein HBH42_021460 [Parastagonospora nodorum]KAH4967448.1 hypothetical protein HBI78_069790 [Parastagonospora nodorum]KAH5099583.1 hypothetical protein HBH72_109160 [Parastagonospora nodorum]KAH5436816.1 hypothetical protein HBI47_068460 [Parastagonospora nodorum]